ncbi:MAG TPA: bifunctional glutamate N-acetyltransferase/amino-acid acetyltransferase ArgJ [Acidimicrobiia bacterium]|nr:bifunctional glutamate N-acetyltransferase/amino-acid acetyltransferase ArgJ [Acidimicrobiia bacterium]
MTVTRVPGFIAHGMSAGIKKDNQLDLAYIGTENSLPALAAGVFTSNKLCAAPVTLTKNNLASNGSRLVGVVVNSGNANAATGDTGYKNASLMGETVAQTLGVDTEYVGVCSTGLIGYQLPIEIICESIPAIVSQASVDGGMLAAQAIMTTDTKEKTFFQEYTDDNGVAFCVGAIAKGAAMLQPNMATMLAFITTNATVSAQILQESLRAAAGQSFNKLTVDGAQSTNDTVLVLSSEKTDEVQSDSFARALLEACQSLAKQMCDDAEGSTKTVRINVKGAANTQEGERGARRVANCQLVKCSWFGKDPYWGRVASELGASGIEYDFATLSIAYGEHLVLHNGVSLIDDYTDSQRSAINNYMENREIDLNIDLGQGDGQGWIWTNDLTFGYVEENMGTS